MEEKASAIMLKIWGKMHEESGAGARDRTGTDLVGGKPIRCIRSAVERACEKAGLEGFRFHDLRHTAVTNMRRAGIDQLTIMEITGHRTMVCFTRYNSFRESDLERAAQRFNTYINEGSQERDG